LQTACILKYEMIPNAGNNKIVCAPSMGHIIISSSVKKFSCGVVALTPT
jgi:hypothetical protein